MEEDASYIRHLVTAVYLHLSVNAPRRYPPLPTRWNINQRSAEITYFDDVKLFSDHCNVTKAGDVIHEVKENVILY